MTADPKNLEDLRDRVRVLEQENDLLAERAEDITLLGLVAEQLGTGTEAFDLLGAVLERVCILKALPYGAYLEARGGVLLAVATYHGRREEPGLKGAFLLREPFPWPPDHSLVLDEPSAQRLFQPQSIPGLAAGVPQVMALVPLRCNEQPGGCLLFLDDRRTAAELDALLPVLARVADLVQARLDNLALIARLRHLNLHLDLEVADRTAELRFSEARYRALFDRVPDGVLLVHADQDAAVGRIEDANATAAAMHGYSLAELKALDVGALGAEAGAEGLDAFEAQVWSLQPGETVQRELLRRRKDGTVFPVEAIGTLVSLDGRPFVLEFARDITQRKRAEQALLQTQRVESVGVLAGGIAHDFNNLLTAILGQTGLALEHLAEDDPGRPHLERALEAAAKAASLTQQMLAYSGRGTFSLQPVDLNGLLRENLGFLETALPKQVAFHLDLDGALTPVTGDATQLQQVIMNLVINGAEAFKDGPGVITLRTRARRVDDREALAWDQLGSPVVPGEYVVVEVSDTGCGMSPEVCERIFDPFFTTKAKGHGLGLSAVQGIIRSHRGGLSVRSREGAGTTFQVLLPAGPEAARGEPAAEPRVSSRPARRRLVLVVDDEDYMLEVVRDMLELRGHAALLAQDGERGLALAEQHGGRIDLVLLDLTMPGLGGVETFRRLRELAPDLPVVLSSGFAAEQATAQLPELDPAGFLQKPYRSADLLQLVEALPRRPGVD